MAFRLRLSLMNRNQLMKSARNQMRQWALEWKKVRGECDLRAAMLLARAVEWQRRAEMLTLAPNSTPAEGMNLCAVEAAHCVSRALELEASGLATEAQFWLKRAGEWRQGYERWKALAYAAN